MNNIETAPTVSIKDKQGNLLFLQVMENSKVINKLIALGMETPKGVDFTLTVANSGHVMEFHHASIDIETVARVANGIKVTEAKEKGEQV